MSGKISAKQKRAIEALIHGSDYETAAVAAGVTSHTLRTWRNENEDFKAELVKRSDNVLGDATAFMKGNMRTAVQIISDVMNDREVPPAVRLRAAVAMLETGLKLTEAAEVLHRLEALERVYYEATQTTR